MSFLNEAVSNSFYTFTNVEELVEEDWIKRELFLFSFSGKFKMGLGFLVR